MGTIQIDGSTPKITVGNATAEDATILFDGNAQDFYIALDDSADDLVIGLGSTIGTTPIISLTEAGAVTMKNVGTGDDNPMVLTLQTSETDMAADDVIGKISFQAPDEGTGTDAVLVSGAIQAVAEGDHSSSSNATRLEFMTGASEAATAKMKLSSAGDLTVTAGNIVIGTSGKGIDFSETADSSGTMTSELLDDYEEGTWIPAWNTGDNGLTIGGTGSYTKIGNTVNLRGHFTIDSSGTGSGDVSFSGLPFTSVNTGGYRASVSSYWSHLAVACTDICGFINTNSVLVYFREGGTTGDGNDLGNHIDQDSHFFFSATYQAA